MTPDAERQRLEGLLTDTLLLQANEAAQRVFHDAKFVSGAELGSPCAAAAMRDVLVSALLAAPPDPAPGLLQGCNAPAPDRSGRCCNKPQGHDGDHWTYGGNELTWPAPGLREALTPEFLRELAGVLWVRDGAEVDDARIEQARLLIAVALAATRAARPADTPPTPHKPSVGCERPDGLLNIHSEDVTCEVCAVVRRQAFGVVKLTPVERDHLVTLLRDAKERGDYYGNRAQYWKRHERLVEKLAAERHD